ncbi:YcgN family cysteine cluster protein [Aestuariibacter sp. AA17]|uniref:YcgN family cysteine cluster protein n=1 Tax=Fluctibacter corallii TaxID=2984329 RepID=A0ABT3A907_9ALTE|nr:YcgN family cysteine cluster protein [Aestuariibacter sp. AA17]MCV2885103.1 YcgN family cysteine cluster protein [Aestuariibacter sp. AA17]
MSEKQAPFWETKTLEEMSDKEWEAICDGCAKCCLHKFIDDETVDELAPTAVIFEGEQVHYTNIVCSLLDTKACSCTRYEERTKLVPDCVKLTKDNLGDIFYMPSSCSYRRLHEGRGLPSWHPLLNKGKKSKMHQLGMSVRNKVVYDHDVELDAFEDYIALWPLEDID